ncbi:hypothetical protein TetV_252 [Tetraselmis virus 1]|uniref:Minor capsid protein P11 C-terminal conserved region domain-containing protein n=1 Tax=Tetraselmis virus 1 TaxID=2060617 RepID=A0A2P0VN69_9VIRU|nr:hypothetical protein QJ968_gp252 [Tetraselmis virus 1]AUF82344.1 hypothetical protein TetV_252 [Tetraselmis virus 1]
MESGGMIFKVLLIVAAGIALLAIIMHYNSVCTAGKPMPSSSYDMATYKNYEHFDAPPPEAHMDTGVPGAVEDVYDMPAPVKGVEQPCASKPQDSGLPPTQPRDTVKPDELLPCVGNTPEEQQFAQLYTTGQGDMQGINFLDAGSQIGLSTRLNRNANLQLRSDPPIAKQPLPFLFSTIEADKFRKPLEIGSESTAIPVDPNNAYAY